MLLKRCILAVCLLVIPVLQVFSQVKFTPEFVSAESRAWADSVLKTLNYHQKIGQLFMVDAYSNRDSVHIRQIERMIDSLHIGGIIFFQGGPVRQALQTNHYQKRSKVPLMIGIDGEWGLNMRLDSTIRFPRQMTLGAGSTPELVYEMGVEIGRQCRRMGIHVNFAPAVDINNNPRNPIINSRSFGEDPNHVALLGKSYMKGMQDEKVLACAKHFPGHGNTDTDSHYSLPVITSGTEQLDSIELIPFAKLISDSLASVMVAHLYIPALDSTINLASTLSSAVVTDLLQEKMGFGGLIFTDALNMKGVANYYPPGEADWYALLAGNDVLLYSEDVSKGIERIHLGIQNCEITQEDIDAHVYKILMAKYWAGLNHPAVIDTSNLIADLNTSEARWLNYRLYDNSVSLLRNKNEILPLSALEKDCIASIVINDTLNNPFQDMLNRYAKVEKFVLPKDVSKKYADSLLRSLDCYERVIVSIHNTSTNASRNFGITDSIKYVIEKINKNKNSILCVFGNPYVLSMFNKLEEQQTLVLSYEDTYLPQYLTAQKIFGASPFSGKLPVSPVGLYTRGMGISPAIVPMVKYTVPEDAGVSSFRLNVIDSIIYPAIRDTAMPGCQVLASKNGKVFYNNAFGHHTYDKSRPVKITDLYDIASVTKIASTALAAMLLVDKHKLDIDAKASKYLPELRHSNKKDITVKEIMAHQAGLQSWIPFYKSTVDSTGLDTTVYSYQIKENYTTPVAEGLYILDSYKDSIWNRIIQSHVEPAGKYVYSDLGLLILQKIIEKISGKPLDEYCQEQFYTPLGLHNMSFHPLKNHTLSVIIPTEDDTVFRKRLVHGYVHDPAAAMMGGVAGHAGLFSNAQSLGVIMQMLLNDGNYGGRQFIRRETVELFTRQAYPGTANRRGLIFDKPDPGSSGNNGPTAGSASPLTFGHTGFTGTAAWADPQSGFVYVFLSNRVHPSSASNKLAKLNIRTEVMDAFYKAMNPSE